MNERWRVPRTLVFYGAGQFIRWSYASSLTFVSWLGASGIGYLEEKGQKNGLLVGNRPLPAHDHLARMPRREARAAVGDRCHLWREQAGALQSAVDRPGERAHNRATHADRAPRRKGRLGDGANRWEIIEP
jgi:hypothetical protein